MSRTLIPLNQSWKYRDSFCDDDLAPDYDDGGFETVTLPHANIEVPYNYFDEAIFQFISCYRTTFTLEPACREQNIFLDFEGVMAYAEVYSNGVLVGSHKGGYTPFTVDLTGKVHFDRPNSLAVKVDSTERPDIPPFGGAIDYLTFGGIYREVQLRIVDRVHIENVFVRPQAVLEAEKRVEATVFLKNTSDQAHTAQLTATINEGATCVATTTTQITIAAQTSQPFDVTFAKLTGVRLWELESPVLYTFNVSLTAAAQDIQDACATRFGFRTAEFTPHGFFLNGAKLKLRGLNRHQTFPYVGPAMPARAQRKDADILKNELRLNLARTSHYPQSRHFLDRCDEIGLLVLEEIPGWQHLGDAAWQQVACENVREMIARDWNHPAIVLWGVRINESRDDHDFYAETNRIAHELDPTRPTGGVRCIPNSELLEDVYTMNDFSHSGGELVLQPQQAITGRPKLVPYLVTEFNGHMYPTKRFDQEERLVEHALRYARIQSRAAADDAICGAIGWCAFDYHTHHNFGSGDRICYHGVMDLFRLPKMAAAFYKSQAAPAQEVVLEPATLWTRGDRSIGGVLPLMVFTNCDYLQCYYGDRLIGTFHPDWQTYPGLAYPPVRVNMPFEVVATWPWADGRLVGYVNGKPALTKCFVKDPLPTQLLAAADDATLTADGSDVTRVVFKIVDQAGNLLPYLPDVLKLTLTGPGEIIGPAEVPFIGGCVAAWVKTQRTAGVITIAAASSRLRANDVTIQVIN